MEDTGREAFREGRHIRRTWIWLASQSIRVVTKDPKLFDSQPGITNDTAKSKGIDRIMAWDRQNSRAI